jgi:sugar phosphate isomerase/epimerase
MNKLGVMQGRLLPKYHGRYQAHPVGYWQDEFEIAHTLGLELIEFIFDHEQAESNPLLHETGLTAIQTVSEQTKVEVKTICADYFMEAPIHHSVQEVAIQSSQMLQKLLLNAKKIGVTDIVIPCVDQSSLKNEADVLSFLRNIRPAKDVAENLGINLALETDLPPRAFREFLATLDSKIFTVNYDTGNSAALGYDPLEELAAYGDRISDIHLKDRPKGGSSVPLGTGDADFQAFFAALAQVGYDGPLIMQAYRDDEGIQVFRRQLAWLRPRLTEWEEQKKRIPEHKEDVQ